MTEGWVEGDTCGRNGCTGVIVEQKVENCSCHINPPCGSCTTPREYCPVCDWHAVDEETSFNDFKVGPVDSKGMWRWWRKRELDKSKIDWYDETHTHFSMRKVGVYPEGTTRAEILEKVKGTFGGKFEYCANGKFSYIAYTD